MIIAHCGSACVIAEISPLLLAAFLEAILQNLAGVFTKYSSEVGTIQEHMGTLRAVDLVQSTLRGRVPKIVALAKQTKVFGITEDAALKCVQSGLTHSRDF